MKQDSSLSPEMQKRIADNQATAMLMEQWVRDNVKDVAFALSDIVEQARLYIHTLGGFEKFAEWGLVRANTDLTD